MMRRPLRMTLYGLAGVLAVVAALAAWVAWRNVAGEELLDSAEAPTMAVAADKTEVARGAYLARAGNCMACHTARGAAPWAGGRGIETPFGIIYSSNLTTDESTGLGRWTRGEFWRAMHHGRSRDGRLLYPAFPYTSFTQVTRADSDALYSYLRTLPPVSQAQPAHTLRFPYNLTASLAVWRALYFTPATFKPEPSQPASWNRGAYLVRGLGHCAACHSARDALGGSEDPLGLAGGLIPVQNWYAPSLSDAAEAGVAGWPQAEVVQLLKSGIAPRGQVSGPMNEVVLFSTQHLSDEDLTAMATYLQALPQQTAPARDEAPPRAPRAMSARGAEIYENRCAQCHGAKGEGVAGAYPRLAGNRAVTLDNTANLVQTVLYGGFGPATPGNPKPFGMPPYVLALDSEEIAAVLTHVRSQWGNQAAPVTPVEVNRVRGGAQ